MIRESMSRLLICAAYVFVLAGCGGESETAGGQHDSSPEMTVDDLAADLDARQDEVLDTEPDQVADVTPPSVEFIQPLDGAEVEGVVTVEVEAQDDTGVVKVELVVGGELVGTDEEAPYEFEWDATDQWSGIYTIKAVAADEAGNTGEASISVKVLGECDESGDCPPSVAFQEIEDGAYVSGVVELKAAASDDDAVVKVRFLVDGGFLAEDDKVPYKMAWDTTEFDDGQVELTAVATDTTDKKATAVIFVTVDNTQPEISLVFPGEGVIQHDEILMVADASDNIKLDRVEFSVDGGEPAVVSEVPWELSYDGSTLASGVHVLEARALDAAGNEEVVTREFLLDRPPTVSILSPDAGATVSGPIAVQAQVEDDIGLGDVVLYVDAAWMTKLDPVGDGLYEDIWSPPYEMAERVLSVVVVDSVGQEGEAAVTVQVDHPVTVELLVCEDGDCEALVDGMEASGVLALKADAQDDGAEIIGVDFLVDAALQHQDTEAPFDYLWGTSVLDDGIYTVKAVAWNSFEQKGETEVVVQVNNCDLDHDEYLATACGGPDCDDGAPGVNPGMADTVGNDQDENCDGMDGVDADGDGWASESSGGDDCDDDAPLVHPCGDDLPGDGVDGDCDGADELSCDDCVPCTTDGFVAGACVHAPVSDAGACDDGDPCTGYGTCLDLVCQPGPPTNCDDGNVCTADGCVSETGCYHLPMDGLPCDGGVCFDSECCAPDCAGAECGDNGCGGSCGTCEGNYSCENGFCVLPGMGCMEYNTCLAVCDDDPSCEQYCDDQVNPLALARWEQWGTCYFENGGSECETVECSGEINGGPCLAPYLGCVQPLCWQLYYWFDFCGDDADCKELVVDSAAPGAVQVHATYEECLDAHYYDDCQTDECGSFIIDQFCIETASTCYSGPLDCVGISYCRAACPDDSEFCLDACYYKGTPQAKAQFLAYLECQWDYCASDPTQECWDAAFEGPCQIYVQACEADECVPAPSCAGQDCGSDGCGGFCGSCGDLELCVEEDCIPCLPDCVDKECGNDGCGGTCGQCEGQGSACDDGICFDPESCDCPPWQECTLDGCVDPPSMGEAAYGGDVIALACYGVTYEGCCAGTLLYYCDDQSGECPGWAPECLVVLDCGEGGNTCGWGEQYFMCVEPPPEPDPEGNLSCAWFSCEPDCEGKVCGPDGCGGFCEGPCEDGNVCTINDLCVDGVCVGSPVSCNDGHECTLDVCDPVLGCFHSFSDALCVSENPCVAGACDEETGSCAYVPVPEGTSCGEGALCVEGECVEICQNECVEGEVGCEGVVPWSCVVPEGELCTVKIFEAPCFEGEVCAAGECCTPECNGALCGDDGCGGSCGSCCPVAPGSHGPCEAIIGFIFDGQACVIESGCGCGLDCEYVFVSVQECEAACSL